MSTATDDQVLAGLKRMLAPEYRDAIAGAATLADAETILCPMMDPGMAGERIRVVREHLRANSGQASARIVGQ